MGILLINCVGTELFATNELILFSGAAKICPLPVKVFWGAKFYYIRLGTLLPWA